VHGQQGEERERWSPPSGSKEKELEGGLVMARGTCMEGRGLQEVAGFSVSICLARCESGRCG
jgi:hypothetical protein